MLHFLSILFSWPNGIVVGNLIASALWAGPALFHLDRRMKQRHDALKKHMSEVIGNARHSGTEPGAAPLHAAGPDG
jgi:hypothetical protein